MSILLRNGTVLIHDANNHVIPTQTSILINNSKIAKIGRDIVASSGTQTIDCTDKIISPGFIDTHHHGWQTQLKGRHANELLLEYMVTGNAQSTQYAPKDVFYGELSGMLELIAGGTTTVVDHAHVTMSPAHAEYAISATASSGIRSVFCFTPIMRVKNFNPLTYHPNPMEDWVMETFQKLAQEGPWGNGRVTLGLGWDFYFLPQEVTKQVFRTATEAGVKTITSHYVNTPQLGAAWGNLPAHLKDMGLLDEKLLFSHSNGASKDAIALIREHGSHISSTPSTELQMAMSRPVCFDAAFQDGGPSGNEVGAQDCGSFGIDCHSYNAGSILSEARLGLTAARTFFNEFHLAQGETARTLPENLSVEAAFNLATIKGAEAVRMEEEIGRIAEGYEADLVIFDALSPAMIGAAQHDPVAAIIMHSSPADIETVIVGGVLRKRSGKLVNVQLESGIDLGGDVVKDSLEWKDVAKEIVRGREAIQTKIDKIDFKEARAALVKTYHIDESVFVD
ncbi:hypothetical protein B0J11DRAFT_514637 [Dendryphion nanum]|uniref:Amidohydrolase-related domain-containing protein n=1 Tax=Dendryphion nanum TaxID=256645 RepID=A0A9P9EKH5_9PLEO|nr:hypothetical protein B0J11DRAFT_514637 [Dendryphion nanum]